MAFTTIPNRTSADTAIPYQDINSLMANTQYFKDVITISSDNIGIGITPADTKAHIYKNASIGAWGSMTLSNSGLRVQDPTSSIYFDGNAIVSSGSSLFFGTNDASSILIGTNDTQIATFDTSGNLGLGTATFGTSAAGVFAIKNGTVPSTSPADTLQIFAVDLSAGNSTLGIRTETAVTTAAAGASDKYLNIKINGTTYKLLLHS